MTALATNGTDLGIMERVLVTGDLSKLTPDERSTYYLQTCKSLGLNPLTKPFDYIVLKGKMTLYAKRDCTDQLRKQNGISLEITSREAIGDVYVVTTKALTVDGRMDESTGAVSIAGLRGEDLANAYMKAETKSKRRVTLSICGLGMMDETEVDTVRDARRPVRQIAAPPADDPETAAAIEEASATLLARFTEDLCRAESKADVDDVSREISHERDHLLEPHRVQLRKVRADAIERINRESTVGDANEDATEPATA